MRLNSLLTFLTISSSVMHAVSTGQNRTHNQKQTLLLDGDGSIVQPLSALDLTEQQAMLGLEKSKVEEKKNSALMLAIKNGQTKIAKQVLDTPNIDINSQDKDGNTALMLAIAKKKTDIAMKILERDDLDVNAISKYKMTALMIAAQAGQKEIVEALLKKDSVDVNLQSDNGNTALIEAILNNQTAIAMSILERITLNISIQNTRGSTALMLAIITSQPDVAMTILEKTDVNIGLNVQDNDGQTALMHAAQLGEKEIVDVLLKKDSVDVNLQSNSGNTALIEAIINNRHNIAMNILKRDDLDINAISKYKMTALMIAAQAGQKEIVEVLLKKGSIDVNLQPDSGNTALIEAILNKQTDIAMTILERTDVNINAQNTQGNTALIEAILNNQPNIAMTILERTDLDINAISKYKMTALMFAAKNGQKEIVEALLKKDSVDVNSQSDNGNTALIEAILNKQTAIAMNILERTDLDVNLQNILGNTALSKTHPTSIIFYKIAEHKSFNYRMHAHSPLTMVIGLALISIVMITRFIFSKRFKILQKLDKKNHQEYWKMCHELSNKPWIEQIKIANDYSIEAIKKYGLDKKISRMKESDFEHLSQISDINSAPRVSNQSNTLPIRQLLKDRQAQLSASSLKVNIESYDNKWPIEEISKLWTDTSELCQGILECLGIDTLFNQIDELKLTYYELKLKCNNLLEGEIFNNEKLQEYEQNIDSLKKCLSKANKLIRNIKEKTSDKILLDLIDRKLHEIHQAFFKASTRNLNKTTWDILYKFFKSQKNIGKASIYSKTGKVGNIATKTTEFNRNKQSYIVAYETVQFEILDATYVKYDELCIMAPQVNEFEVASINRFFEACEDFLKNEVMQLNHGKSVDEKAMMLIEDTGFLEICEQLQKKGTELTEIGEGIESDEEGSKSSEDSVYMWRGSSKQQPEYLSSLTSKQTPLETLLEHIKDELGIEVELKGAAEQSQYSMRSVSSIATVIKTDLRQRRTELSTLVEAYVDSFNYSKESAAPDMSDTIKERNKTMGEIALALIARKGEKSDLQLKKIEAKIKENRQEDHLPIKLVIHNSVAHTDYQTKLSQADSDKVLMEFSAGMARLNDEFISFGLSEVMLSEEQLESLRDMYEKKSNKIQGGSAGSHYRITGPFIIPSIKQPLSPLLICDRWVALSVFSRMQKIPHIKDL